MLNLKPEGVKVHTLCLFFKIHLMSANSEKQIHIDMKLEKTRLILELSPLKPNTYV